MAEAKETGSTKILSQKHLKDDNKFDFAWIISPILWRDYYQKYLKKQKKDGCISDIVCHKPTNTKWMLQFHPVASVSTNIKNNNEKTTNQRSILYVLLMNKPNHITEIKTKTNVYCRELNKFCSQINDVSEKCKDIHQTFFADNLQEFEKLTFAVQMEFEKIVKGLCVCVCVFSFFFFFGCNCELANLQLQKSQTFFFFFFFFLFCVFFSIVFSVVVLF